MKRPVYRSLRTPRARRRHAAIATELYRQQATIRDYGSVEHEFDACRPKDVARQYLRGEGVRV